MPKKIVVLFKIAGTKSKAAIVESEASPSLQKLTEEISALTTVVTSASMGTPKTKSSSIKLRGSLIKENGGKGNGQNVNSPKK